MLRHRIPKLIVTAVVCICGLVYSFAPLTFAVNQPPFEGDGEMVHLAPRLDTFIVNYGVLNNQIGYPFMDIYVSPGFTAGESISFPVYWQSGDTTQSTNATIELYGIQVQDNVHPSALITYIPPVPDRYVTFALDASHEFVIHPRDLSEWAINFRLISINEAVTYTVKLEVSGLYPQKDDNGNIRFLEFADSVVYDPVSAPGGDEIQPFDFVLVEPFLPSLPSLAGAIASSEYGAVPFICTGFTLGIDAAYPTGRVSGVQYKMYYETDSTTIRDLVELAPSITPWDPGADYFQWFADLFNGILSIQIVPGVSFGSLMFAFIGCTLAVAFLKLYSGG